MLYVNKLNSGYGDIQVLYDVSISVKEGEVVALLGSNGAGKTTTLMSISRILPILSGSIEFEGKELDNVSTEELANIGIAHVPQGRGIFQIMTVSENLELGSYCSNAKAERKTTIKKVYELFPRLEERKNQIAGTLSGGEQQMLAIGRALMMKPKLLMLDEPSLGLAPVIVDSMFDKIKEISKQGVAILLVEQNVYQALTIAERGYVLEIGKIVLEGSSEFLKGNEYVKEAYLGI